MSETLTAPPAAAPCAIVELGNSHGECIYSQVKFLREAGVPVHLICSEALAGNLASIGGLEEALFLDFSGSLYQKYKAFKKAAKYLRDHSVAKVIFNTVDESRVLRALLLGMARDVELYGIVHNVERFHGGALKAYLDWRFKGFYTLEASLAEQLHDLTSIRSSHFHPIFFPHYEDTSVIKREGEFWVCVPGEVLKKRRDYEELILQCKQVDLAEGIKFVFLGPSEHKRSDGAWLKAELATADLSDRFILFDRFIPNDAFHSYARQSDLMLPLIHPDTPSAAYYRYRTSGAFNLSRSYQVPLLVEQELALAGSLAETGIRYAVPEMLRIINQLKTAPASLEEARGRLKVCGDLEFAQQQATYLELLNFSKQVARQTSEPTKQVNQRSDTPSRGFQKSSSP